jgi:flagellar hook assembly protein FlgD
VIITKNDLLKLDSLRANAYVIGPVLGELSKITYSLARGTRVTLNIKDPNGNHFKNVVSDDLQTAGAYEYFWDGTNDAGNFVTIPGHYTLEFFIETPAQNDSDYRRGNVTVVR